MDSSHYATPHRQVRSFVLRGGRITAAQERALNDLWPAFGIEFGPQPLEFDSLFGRSAPRLLEIGFGTGDALAAFAQSHPETDCIGIEVHRAGVGHLLLRAHNEGLGNLRVICHDAVEVLQTQIPPSSLAAIHLFFPDPWPKKRHHKRRLVQPDFVALMLRALAARGELRLATDWEPYALHMLEVLRQFPELENLAADLRFAARFPGRPLTRFERRGQRLGHAVWDLHFRKRAVA